jgi:hypothetical protein
MTIDFENYLFDSFNIILNNFINNKMKSIAFIGAAAATMLSNEVYYSTGPDEWSYLMTEAEPLDIMNVQYGDVTVTIAKATGKEDEQIPERYSSDSDDKLMNMLIKKGYAFSKSRTNTLKVELDCGCNCNCCFG